MTNEITIDTHISENKLTIANLPHTYQWNSTGDRVQAKGVPVG